MFLKKEVFAALTCCVLAIGSASTARATHIVPDGTSVDVIDYTFASGGGTFDGTLTFSNNYDWFVFSSTAGDIVTIETLAISGDFNTGLSLFSAAGNGLVEVGDVTGTDLIMLVNNNDGGVGVLSRIQYTIGGSGQYAIAVGGIARSRGNYRVSLSGNRSVPEPATLGLLGLGLLGAGVAKKRRRRA